MAVNIVECIDDSVKIQNVIVSVSDKKGLDKMIKGLVEVNPDIKIYSTGGTFSAIKAMNIKQLKQNLIQISDYTGQPEMQGGLVKTLDFKIYLGLLSETYNEAHKADLQRTGAVPMDMVIVNLYPFRETIARPDATIEMARANIDIGGPCMIRASAKNFLRVAVVTNPADYDWVLDELKKTGGKLSLQTRFELAKKAFALTAEYDTAIAKYLNGVNFTEASKCYRKMN
jgi:phosphoribosylaminoimidazolecarboxamide formyltransferase/IMP cyclohydrolase